MNKKMILLFTFGILSIAYKTNAMEPRYKLPSSLEIQKRLGAHALPQLFMISVHEQLADQEKTVQEVMQLIDDAQMNYFVKRREDQTLPRIGLKGSLIAKTIVQDHPEAVKSLEEVASYFDHGCFLPYKQ